MKKKIETRKVFKNDMWCNLERFLFNGINQCHQGAISSSSTCKKGLHSFFVNLAVQFNSEHLLTLNKKITT